MPNETLPPAQDCDAVRRIVFLSNENDSCGGLFAGSAFDVATHIPRLGEMLYVLVRQCQTVRRTAPEAGTRHSRSSESDRPRGRIPSSAAAINELYLSAAADAFC
jgi:hypothetical protein